MTTEQLATLKEVAENRIRTERRNVPETTMTYSEYLNAADAFREAFTPTTCLELLEEVERLTDELSQSEKEKADQVERFNLEWAKRREAEQMLREKI